MDGLPAEALDAIDRFGDLVRSVWADGDAVLLDLTRRRIAVLLRNPGELVGEPPAPGSGSGSEQAALDFAEQFVIDVTGIGDEERHELAAALGAGAPGFALAVYVLEFEQRCRMAIDLLLPGVVPAPPSAATGQPPGDPWTAMDDVMRAIARLAALDPLTSELVRLRGARVHGCRLCQSRLSVDAVDAGGDDATFDAVDAYDRSDLDERHKVALRLTDALITQPTDIAGDLADDVRSRFAPGETVELVLDVVRNAANKIAVALGADAPNVVDGVEYFTVDTTGAVVAGADPDSVRSPTPG